MPEPSLFRHYQIVQDADGRNVELIRDETQVAVLAFDTRQLIFVHCHVLLEPPADRAAFEKAAHALQQGGHPLLARLLDFGEDEGNPYLITTHVDGETVSEYLARQENLPAWLAAIVAHSTLESTCAYLERAGKMTSAPLESFRLVQTGPASGIVQMSDYTAALSASGNVRGLKPDFEKQVRFLQAMFQPSANAKADAATRLIPCADFAELLSGCLQAASPSSSQALRELAADLLRSAPAAAEIPTANKPRSLLSSHLATYQEVARGVVNLVRIQSQRLDMASPYSMRGTLSKTGRAVLIEQSPPPRMVGTGPLTLSRHVMRLEKQKHGNLVPVTLLHDADGITCLGEEAVEGIHLMDVMRERRSLDAQEVYLVLACLDAALSSLEKAGLETPRLRLDDVFLITGFPRDDKRSAKLLLAKLNDWPAFSIMIRAHPTLASMSGRGLDPAVLLPAEALTGWAGPWMAALGCYLLGVEPLPGCTPAPATLGDEQRTSVGRLLREEMQKCQGKPSSRGDFLSRFARVLHHHDLAQSGPAPVSAEPVQIQPRPRQRTVPIGSPSADDKKVPPVSPAPLTSGISPVTEKPTIGFAELLFRDTAVLDGGSGPDWAKTAADAPPTIHPDEVLLPESDYVPFWLRFAVFLGGSMILGGLLAHLGGEAQWQKAKAASPAPPAATSISVPKAIPVQPVAGAATAPEATLNVQYTQPDPPAAPTPELPTSATIAPEAEVSASNIFPKPSGLKSAFSGEPER